jgi:hypothetical protein
MLKLQREANDIQRWAAEAQEHMVNKVLEVMHQYLLASP